MKKIVLSLAAIAALCSFDGQQGGTDFVTRAAKSEFAKFFALIPQGRETQYGFAPGDNAASCTMGKPLQMLTLTKEFYEGGYQADKKNIEATHEWRVPVILNGDYKTMVTVAGDEQDAHIVDFGGAGLAKELRPMFARSTGDRFGMLRLYPSGASFFVAMGSGSLADATYTPLASALMAMPQLQQIPYTQREALAAIKEMISQTSSKN
jgi:hypothetical protein